MPDYAAIAAAVAAKYVGVGPPAGEPAIGSSTAALPNAIGQTPCVLVFVDRGDFDTGNGTRLGSTTVLVRFYLTQSVDLARDVPSLEAWLSLLVDVFLTGIQLGGLVVTVRLERWRLGTMRYAGDEFSGIELELDVVTSEPWSAVA